jgi:cell division protein FtsZ
VNEACKLIGESTRNDDAQINFGVVLDEELGDQVKITVIATGFQREAAPEVERRSPHFPFSVTTAPEVPADANAAPLEHTVAAAPQTAAETGSEAAASNGQARQEDLPNMPDYEVPAYLRKQRRLVQ